MNLAAYIFHLRGNARTSGEQRRKEKTMYLVKVHAPQSPFLFWLRNPHAKEHGKIYFHDIGDYLSREQKTRKNYRV